jgi:hypothetical protein
VLTELIFLVLFLLVFASVLLRCFKIMGARESADKPDELWMKNGKFYRSNGWIAHGSAAAHEIFDAFVWMTMRTLSCVLAGIDATWVLRASLQKES